MWRLINALGIRYVGEATAQLLARHFPSLDKLMAADQEALLHVEGVGEQVAASLQDFFANDRNQALLKKLTEAGVRGLPPEPQAASPLGGKTFVFTGGLRRLIPGRSQGDGRGPGRQGDFIGLRQDRLRGGGGRSRGASWPKPGSWG